MTKTSVYLTEAERKRLALLSRQEGRSQAQILRDAIAQYRPKSPPKRHFQMAGSGASTDGRSVADIPDEELLEGFGEDR